MKILIIGQAPPAVKQKHPYDTTMLYDMLSWVGISKEDAQNMFEFEAMTNEFPGFIKNGHASPRKDKMREHYENVLKPKFIKTNGVIVLGKVAENALGEFGFYAALKSKRVINLIHPSKRNYARIMRDKELITQQLKEFLA